MLRNPLPSRATRGAGLVLVAAVGIGGAVAAWASQTAKPSHAAGQPVIETNFVITHRDDAGKVEHFTLADHSGQPISFGLGGETAHFWTGEFTAQTADAATLDFSGTVRLNGEIRSQPTVRLGSGTSATLEVSAPDGSDGLRIEVTLTLHDAGWTPPAVAVVDRPAEENTSYRESFPPHYPQAALDAHQSGHVEIKVFVDELGAPQSAEVAAATPPEAGALFGPESVRTVMQWHFNPARHDGKPVSGTVLVPIDFSLDG